MLTDNINTLRYTQAYRQHKHFQTYTGLHTTQTLSDIHGSISIVMHSRILFSSVYGSIRLIKKMHPNRTSEFAVNTRRSTSDVTVPSTAARRRR